MNQTTTGWPTPAAPIPTKRTWTTGHKIAAAVAIVVALAAIGAATDKKHQGNGGAGIIVLAGWDANHVANLSIKISDKDGVSSTRADCAAEGIAGSMTFLAWESLSPSDQYTAILTAEAAC